MKYVFGLCKGRHEVPVENYIFEEEITDPTDFTVMENRADNAIPKDADQLDVYVTGLTPAMLAVVTICFLRKINLTAYHYDRETGSYIPQKVITWFRCGFCGKNSHPCDPACGECGAT